MSEASQLPFLLPGLLPSLLQESWKKKAKVPGLNISSSLLKRLSRHRS
jgi:hypothetical protein